MSLELLTTEELILELAKRFPNLVLAADRQATPDDTRTYITIHYGEPWRCLAISARLIHHLNLKIDIEEFPEQGI